MARGGIREIRKEEKERKENKRRVEENRQRTIILSRIASLCCTDCPSWFSCFVSVQMIK
jgi:hypothetical protein